MEVLLQKDPGGLHPLLLFLSCFSRTGKVREGDTLHSSKSCCSLETQTITDGFIYCWTTKESESAASAFRFPSLRIEWFLLSP